MSSIEWHDDGPTPAPVNVISELIVLLIKRSELELGEHTARGLVRGAFRSMLVEQGIDLGPLRDALAGHETYDADKAAPVFYRLESLKDAIGMDVVLPKELDPDDADARERADKIEVSSEEQERVRAGLPPLDTTRRRAGTVPPAASAGKAKGQSRGKGSRSGALPEKGKRPESSNRKLSKWAVPAIALAIAGFGFTGYQAYTYGCAGPEFEDVEAGLGSLPVDNPRKLGSQVGAVLRDESWLSKPAAERKAQLGQALDQLEAQGVDTLLILSERDEVLASAQRVDGANVVRLLR